MLSKKSAPYTLLMLLFVLTAAGFSSYPANANAKIEVLVNDDAITSYDVLQRSRFQKLATRKPITASMKKQVLEELIDERLMVQRARQMGISIDYQRAEAQFARIAQRSKLTPSKFEQLMRQSGVDAQTFKDRLAIQGTWQQIVSQRLRRDVGTRRSELETRIRETSDQETSTQDLEYNIGQVIVIAPGGSKSAIQTAQNTAKRIRQDISGCNGIKSKLGSYKGAIYKAVGLRRESELPPSSLKRIGGLSDGQLSSPVVEDSAVNMVVVCSRREVRSNTIVDKDAEQEVMDEEFQVLSRRMLRDLRQDAVIVYR